MNTIMSLLLRSPLHSLISSQIMLLSFHGRKTGKLYTTPVGYMREGNTITLFTGHQWWRNLQHDAPVTVHIGKNTLHGTANVTLDKTTTLPVLHRYLQKSPNAARAFSVSKNSSGDFDAESLQDAVQRFTMMQIQLT
jgi:deazaflavin-dependent oxidoreductase (nitroreductase family)